MSDSARPTIAALRQSHERLRGLTETLGADGLRAPSYDSDWTIAQVLSHIGSQAEIMDSFVVAALAGEEAPSNDSFPPVWDRWNALSPEEQRDASLASNEAALQRLEGLDDEALAGLKMQLFGFMEADAAGFALMRLREHAAHTWDVAVAFDPTATVAPTAIAQMGDGLGDLIGHMAKPQGKTFALRIDAVDTGWSYVLSVGDPVTLVPSAAAGDDAQTVDGSLQLPAEALVRLLYGRLDPDHTPDAVVVDAPDVTLEDLRAVFPGF